METRDYLRTVEGKLSRSDWRRRRRIRITLSGLEPRGKNMPDADKAELQAQVLEELQRIGSQAFRGLVALSMKFSTTAKTPSFPQVIAKNLLDLLSVPVSRSISRRKALLFQDDRQVQVLSVECHHGSVEPAVLIEAASLRDFLEDLRLADEIVANQAHEVDRMTSRTVEGALERFTDILRNQREYRRQTSVRVADALVRMARMDAQKELLGVSHVTVRDLATIYRVRGTGSRETRRAWEAAAQAWERMFNATPLVLSFPELPQQKGSSKAYRALIDTKVDGLKKQYARVLDPLVVPVGLQVLVKPGASRNQSRITDLDNVVKKYVLPKINKILAPPSSIVWGLTSDDQQELKRFAGDEDNPNWTMPPASTKRGVMRFEVWRLPEPGSGPGQGFVGVAVVAEQPGSMNAFSRIDGVIDNWETGH